MGALRGMKNIYASSCTDIQVPFHDVDMMMVVWHGHYVKYFEVARCDLLDKIQYNYTEMVNSGFAWPVVDMALRYVKPARFGRWITVEASLVEYEYRLRIDYVIRDRETGEKLTKGHTIQVAVRVDNHEMCLASPPVLAEKLGIVEEA